MHFDLLHPTDQLVMMMDRIYYRGMTTTSGGNLSIKDADGGVWITPSGIDKGNLRREDIMRVRSHGAVEGPHRPSSEYPFHLAVFERRPDVGAVLIHRNLNSGGVARTRPGGGAGSPCSRAQGSGDGVKQ
jgi:L-fuculose-phosphate aldolase